MEYYSIGELCSITKGSTGIMKAVPGPYPLVTTGADRKSSREYEFDDEAVCIPLVSSTGHGHKSLNYIHYQSGKFALGTILAAVIPKDKSVLSAEYLQRYLFFFKEQLVVSLMKGAANVSLAIRDIAKIQVPVPPISKQKEFIELFNKAEDGKLCLLHENQNQASYLTQLRQAILQEAIEGKLTADWRKENPVRKGDPDYDAEALLEKIQAEKEKLIKEKIFKREKKQESAIVVEIKYPTEWIAPHLGDVAKYITDGTHQTPTYVSSGRPFLSAQNVKPFKFMPINYNYVSESAFIEYTKSIKAEKNDLLVGRVGSKGETAVIDIDIDFAFYVSLALVKTFKELTLPKYLAIVMNSPFGNEYATANMSSLGASAGNFNLGRIRSFPIPLPPIVEQQAIVERVEKLLSMVDELEKQVFERKEQSEQLMQAVLREAFEGGK